MSVIGYSIFQDDDSLQKRGLKIELYDTDASVCEGEIISIPIEGNVYRDYAENTPSKLPLPMERFRLYTRQGIQTTFTLRFTTGANPSTVECTSDDTGAFSTVCVLSKPLNATSTTEVKVTIDGETVTARTIHRNGLSVISDIDDTIKITDVLNTFEMIENTIVKEYKPTLNVPQLFEKLIPLGVEFGSDRSSFHYISGSPCQLNKPLKEFIEKYYPKGSICLRRVNTHDITSVIGFITGDMYEYKLSHIESLIRRFPDRAYALIGDNGQKDPEVYAKIYSKFPKHIQIIYIRIYTKKDDVYERMKDVPKDVIIKIPA